MEDIISDERSFFSIHGLIIVVSIVLPLILRLVFYEQVYVLKSKTFRPHRKYSLGSLVIEITETIRLTITEKGNDVFSATVGTKIPCHADFKVIENIDKISIEFPGYAKLTIERKQEGNHENKYYDIDWESGSLSVLEDHVDMHGSHWYGGGHVFRHSWPMEKWDTDFGPCVTGEAAPIPLTDELYGGVQERVWFTSRGVGVVAQPDVPLFASFNYEWNTLARLRAEWRSPYRRMPGRGLGLRYTVAVGGERNPRSGYRAVSSRFYRRPGEIPDRDMFRYPIWSTWASCKTDVTQNKVLDLAKAIHNHGFKAAQIEIDDGWSTKYGDLMFDRNKFPDPSVMMENLKDLGFSVTIWVHPFVSFLSQAFRELQHKGALVKWRPHKLLPGNLPGVVSWWNGYSALIDVTNPDGADLFRQKLISLKNRYNIKSFKVDGGEGSRVSSWMELYDRSGNPNIYTERFAEMVLSLDRDTRAQELRVATRSQHLPCFVRLQDKDSSWGDFNGLGTVIPHVLTQGLLGYPFVLPDMIGGNAYSLLPGRDARPDRELYIRWVQLTALLPAMQFSLPPWDYDPETEDIAREMCALHERHSLRLIHLAEEAAKSGDPIIRPLWWIAPEDPVAQTISSQFLVGDDVIVAPVMYQGARSRDVYLPAGRWRDQLNNNLLEGGRWHKNYPAYLKSLPHFIKI